MSQARSASQPTHPVVAPIAAGAASKRFAPQHFATDAVNRETPHVIAAVLPCYKVADALLGVLARIGPECSLIYVVDDCCPDRSGDIVLANCTDSRVRVIRHAANLGVGGAVMTGYAAAMQDGGTIIVKIDGDGQMAPELVPIFVAPIVRGEADYTKGNRFYRLDNITRMPAIRIFGNSVLSMMAKLSTGYWNIFDPTNGYTAIHAEVARQLSFDKISQRYFFETDMLFRLNTARAVVVDVPIDAVYGDEKSNLRISEIVVEFIGKHLRNFCKRVFYNYFLRDVSIASIELMVGIALLLFGLLFGAYHWILSARAEVETPAGTVMLAAVGVLMGVQLILAFLSYDIASVPKRAIHPLLNPRHVPTSRHETGTRASGTAAIEE